MITISELASINQGVDLNSIKYIKTRKISGIILTPKNIEGYSFLKDNLSFAEFTKLELQLEFGDILIYPKEAGLEVNVYKCEYELPVIPNQSFIIIRTHNSYLKKYFTLKRYREKFLKYIYNNLDSANTLIEVISQYKITFNDTLEDIVEIEVIDESVEKEDIKFNNTEKTNLSEINMIQKTMGLTTIISRIEENEINLATSFQRKMNLWSEEKMCKLIESIILRFPIPAFYFDMSNDNFWEVVDGLQRLSSIKKFVVDKTLKLSKLDFLVELDGKGYDDLSRQEQRRILEFEVVTYLITSSVPKEIKYNLFKRINSGALTLNYQEIRHALNSGKPADILKTFSESREFIETIEISDKLKDRMQDREIVLRYLAFRITHYRSYSGNIVNFLDEAMEKLNIVNDTTLRGFERDFKHSLITMKKIFGAHVFKRSIIDVTDTRSRRFSNVIYEVWMNAISKLTIEDRNKLVEKKNRINSIFKGLLRGDDIGMSVDHEFDALINERAYTSKRLIKRFEIIENIVKNTLIK